MADSSKTLEVILAFRDRLTSGTKTALQGIRSFATSAKNLIGGIASQVFNLRNAIVGLATGFAARAIFGFVKSVAQTGDELLEASQKTGLAVETLSELQFAAEQSGVSFESLVQSILKFQRNLQEFRQGAGGEAAEGIKILGDDFADAVADGAPLEELLALLASRFEDLATAEEKVFVAQKLFGKSGTDLIPFLREGKDGIEALMAVSREIGAVWSETDARAADSFGDALDKLKTSLRALAEAVVKPLLPAFTKLVETMTSFVVEHRDEVLGFFRSLLEVAQRVLPAIGRAIGDLAEAFGTLLSPLLSLREFFVEFDLGKAAGEVARLTAEVESLKKGLTSPSATIRETHKGLLGVTERDLAQAQEHLESLRKEYELLLQARQSIQGLEGVPRPGTGFFPEALGALDQAIAEERERQARSREERRKEEFLRTLEAHRESLRGPEPLVGIPAAAGDESPLQLEVADQVRASNRALRGLEGIAEALREIRDAGLDTFQQLKAATLDFVGTGLDQTLDAFGEVIDRTKGWRDAFKDAAKGILSDLSKILLRLVAMRAIGAGLSLLPTGVLGPLPAAAEGTPRTRGPTLAGESGPEAVIPLSRGRFVPVELMGSAGGGGTTVINIQTIDAKSFDGYFRDSAGRQSGLLSRIHASQWQQSEELRRRFS